MLTKLQIKNYAIIDDLELELRQGLNIITGETGAGKSILLGALNLVLGERAEASSVSADSGKCVIEAFFKVDYAASTLSLFESHDLDIEDEVIIRREINSNGKSRAFINDTPVNLSVLKKIGASLIDLHQQYDTQDLQSSTFQLEILDAIADNKILLEEYGKEYELYKQNKQKFEELKNRQIQAQKEFDYLQFQYDELSTCDWKPDEIENLDAELKLLQHAEQIKEQLTLVYTALDGTEEPITQQIKTLLNKLKSQESLHAALPSLCERMYIALVELKDISEELEQIESKISHDRERISMAEERISKGFALLKKHSLKTTNELISLQQGIETKLTEFRGMDDSLSEYEKKMHLHHKAAELVADELSTRRKSVVTNLVKEIQALLSLMEMPNARIKIELTDTDLQAHGSDKVDFLFDANLSEKFESIGKVASGGERSRLMLSIQSLVAKKLKLPTLIFDEIDTGISGEAAKQVGLIMKKMSTSHQLIVVTHQPQIAAKADHHYYIHKQKKGERIHTGVKVLEQEERVQAIAQMISGSNTSAASLKSASEMMAQ